MPQLVHRQVTVVTRIEIRDPTTHSLTWAVETSHSGQDNGTFDQPRQVGEAKNRLALLPLAYALFETATDDVMDHLGLYASHRQGQGDA
jgi:hypothetical protein